MAARNPDIRTIEACGVTVDVDISNLIDARFTTAMGRVSDDTISESEKLVWYTRALDVLFDGDTWAIQTKLAEANGGKLSLDEFNEFFNAIITCAGEQKN